MSERIFESLKELLTQQGARFRVVAHESAGTSAEVAKARGTQLGQGAKALVCTIKGFKDGQISFAQNLNLADNAQSSNASCVVTAQGCENGACAANLTLTADQICANVPQQLKLSSDKPAGRNGRIYVLAVFAADHKTDLKRLAEGLSGTKASLVSPDEVGDLTDCVIGSVPPFSFHDKLLLIADPSLFGRFDEIAFNAGLLDHSIILNARDYARIAAPRIVSFTEEAQDGE